MSGGEELSHLVPTEDDRETFWTFGADDLLLGPVLAEGDTVEEVQGAANLIVQAPRGMAAYEVKQVLPDVVAIKLIGRFAKILGELGDGSEVGFLSARGQIPHAHVFKHALP